MAKSLDQAVTDFLESHRIGFERCDHPAVYTCEEAEQLVPELPGARTKNLFLRDRKGKRHFLLIVQPEQSVDLRALSKLIGSTPLGMASPERLKKHLGVDPGAVSFLSLIHDTAGAVEVLIDEAVWSASHITSHPMVNTATLVLSHGAVERILELSRHDFLVLSIPLRS